MNKAPHHPPVHPEASLRDAGLHDLLADLFRLGPAPTRSRELFAGSITLILLGVVIGVVQPGPGAAAVIGAVVLGHLAIRWALGVRMWRQR